MRVYNDDPGFAPAGHTVIQTMLPTDYAHWAKSGSRYNAEKAEVATRILERLDRHLPGVAAAQRVTNIATPLTFRNTARSWRGAYEGWLPTPESIFSRTQKTLPGLERFYMAGQWVEPGGGVPNALMSGRHVVQLMCAHHDRQFNP